MFTQRLVRRTFLAVTVISLSIPLMMGQGCPSWDPDLLAPDSDTGQDNAPGDGAAGALRVDAGPDRAATVGASIVLCGTVEGGEGPYAATWTPASAMIDANTLTPTFVPPAEGEYVLTLTVSDQKGLTGSRSIKINALDHAALSSLKWGANFSGNGYQVLATFTKPLDEATAENVANYRTTPQSEGSSSGRPGEIVAQVTTTPTSATLSADKLVVTLLFNTGTLNRDTRFDISVNDGILGADGVAVAEVENFPAIANSADTKAPTVASRRWATGKQVADAEAAKETEIWDETGLREDICYNYIVEVVFSETMDPESAEDTSAYRIQEGEDGYHPQIASLAADGRTLTLIFQDGPLSSNSKLDVGLGATVDMNGLVLALDAGKSVSANADDKTAPQIIEDGVHFVEGVDDDCQVITIDFNEPMDKASLALASSYRLGGITATEAKPEADGRRVTVSFAAGAFTTSSKLTIPGNTLKDVNGVALAAQTDLAVLPAEEAGGDGVVSPGVPTLTWLSGNALALPYRILAEFPVGMDKAAVENKDNWRLWRVNGINTEPVVLNAPDRLEIVLSSQTTGHEIAGRTAILSFWIDSMNRTDTIEVSVNNSMRDINNRPVDRVVLPIATSELDTTAPDIWESQEPMTLPGGAVLPANTPVVLWSDCTTVPTGGQDLYKVTVWFSELLDGASAVNVENYSIEGNLPTAAKAVQGNTVVLEFAEFDRPLSNTDALELLALVRDINGLANTVRAPVQMLGACDATPPELVSVSWVSNPEAYQVAVKFNEVMDRNSAEFLASWTLLDIDGIAQIPTEAGLDLEDPTRLLLTFGAGSFPADAQLMFAGDVRDISGNTLSGGASGGWPRMVSPEPDDSLPLQIIAAEWVPDYAGGYGLWLRFSEPIDAANPGTYTLDGVEPWYFAINDGGCSVVLAFPIGSNPTVFGRGARLGSSGIKDLSGHLTAADNRGVTANVLDMTPPTVEEAAWESDPINAPYLIAVEFDEVLDATSAQTTNNYQITGTFIKPDLAVLDPLDGRTVHLTFTVASLPGGWIGTQLDISVGNSILDINGLPVAQVTQDIE